MKTIKHALGISATGLLVFFIYSCKTSTPGDAVVAAMEKEIIKEKTEELIDEEKVPEVVVEAFLEKQPNSIKRQWLVYRETPEEKIDVKIPEVYIVAFNDHEQNYRAKYNEEGEIIDLNHLISLSVLPEPALDLVQNGEYKDWQVVGDVYETLDNITNETIGFIVTVEKADQRERLFFDTDGSIVKIQKLIP